MMIIMRTTIIILLAVLLKYFTAKGCRLQGFDSGVCAEPTDFDVQMPFCYDVIQYRACLPNYQSLWYNHSALAKDRWIEKLFNQTVIQRMVHETSEELADAGVNEWNEPLEIVPRFTDNPDCVNAFRNYFCWLNFPRCDAEGRSLVMCRSVCENFFLSCQQPKDLWRCGDPKYVNGYSPEISETRVDGKLVYNRYPFPGSPFRDNAFEADEATPIVICTPSLQNHAMRINATSSVTVLLLIIALFSIQRQF